MASSKRRLSRLRIARERDRAPGPGARFAERDVKAMDGVEKEQGAHALVEIVAVAAEAVERGALGQQFGESRPAALRSSERLRICGVARCDDVGERTHGRIPAESDAISRSASSSSKCESTSSRSRPFNASAICAISKP